MTFSDFCALVIPRTKRDGNKAGKVEDLVRDLIARALALEMDLEMIRF